jgi:Glycosyltransferase family 87
MKSELRRSRIVPALVLALVCLGSAAMVYYELDMFVPRAREARATIGLGQGYFYGNDFYPIWLTLRASQNGRRDLYSHDMTRAIQTGLFGRSLDPRNRTDPPPDYRQYAYPAFANLLLWPSAFLEFPRLRIVLTLLLPVLAATSVGMWLKALDWKVGPIWAAVIIVFTLGTHQMLEAFFALQPGVFVEFFLAGAALAIRRKRLLLAGVLCALTLIKPQVTALAILFLLLWSLSDWARARFWQAFLPVALVMMIASSWLWPHWVRDWITVLFGYHLYAPPALVKVLLGPHVPDLVGTMIITVLLAVGIWTAWRHRRACADSFAFWFTFSLLLAITTVALLPGQAIYDHAVLIPGILILLRGRSTARIPAVLWHVGAVLLLWPFLAASWLLVVRPVLSPAVLYAPVANEVALPFAVLALLAWNCKTNMASGKTAQLAAVDKTE